ncbi:MAG TPA: response regulator transcription factor [Novosphingobium sp.]|nr:response regulator transcription factor [Novosphingobium sp.]
MKILLLEDDAVLSEHLVRVLGEAGHTVDTCRAGQDAIYLASTQDYGVLILDRMVEGIDGLAALKALRAMGVRAPALFLTAMTGVDDRVDGLDAGGDDYLAKPFAAREFLARVHALGRRVPLADVPSALCIGDIEIDRLKRSVTRGGQALRLQAQEYKLLEYLMLHAGQVVTRSMLLENVWSYHFDTRTNIIESHMSRLRAKLCETGRPDPIQTLRGAGYRFHEQ